MADFPSVVKHMALAIMQKTGLPGPTKERFASALEIAKAQCAKYGYTSGNEATSKGRKHDQQGMEGARKNKLFDSMYAQYIAGQGKRTDKGVPGGEPPPLPKNDAHYLGRNEKKGEKE
jgi:hypothetical protein